MPKEQKGKAVIRVNITGDVSGRVVVGDNNQVIKSVAVLSTAVVTQQEISKLLHDLKIKIHAEVLEDKREDALSRVLELEQTLLEKEPNLVTVGYVKRWFDKNLPHLADTVLSITKYI